MKVSVPFSYHPQRYRFLCAYKIIRGLVVDKECFSQLRSPKNSIAHYMQSIRVWAVLEQLSGKTLRSPSLHWPTETVMVDTSLQELPISNKAKGIKKHWPKYILGISSHFCPSLPQICGGRTSEILWSSYISLLPHIISQRHHPHTGWNISVFHRSIESPFASTNEYYQITPLVLCSFSMVGFISPSPITPHNCTGMSCPSKHSSLLLCPLTIQYKANGV